MINLTLIRTAEIILIERPEEDTMVYKADLKLYHLEKTFEWSEEEMYRSGINTDHLYRNQPGEKFWNRYEVPRPLPFMFSNPKVESDINDIPDIPIWLTSRKRRAGDHEVTSGNLASRRKTTRPTKRMKSSAVTETQGLKVGRDTPAVSQKPKHRRSWKFGGEGKAKYVKFLNRYRLPIPKELQIGAASKAENQSSTSLSLVQSVDSVTTSSGRSPCEQGRMGKINHLTLVQDQKPSSSTTPFLNTIYASSIILCNSTGLVEDRHLPFANRPKNRRYSLLDRPFRKPISIRYAHWETRGWREWKKMAKERGWVWP